MGGALTSGFEELADSRAAWCSSACLWRTEEKEVEGDGCEGGEGLGGVEEPSGLKAFMTGVKRGGAEVNRRTRAGCRVEGDGGSKHRKMLLVEDEG